MPAPSLTLHRVLLNPDLKNIIHTGTGREDTRSQRGKGRYPDHLIPLQGVPLHPRHDAVVRAVILSGDHADADIPIVRHRVVPDADVEGVPVCSSKATHDVNAHGGVTGDCVTGEGRFGDDVVIALRGHNDP